MLNHSLIGLLKGLKYLLSTLPEHLKFQQLIKKLFNLLSEYLEKLIFNHFTQYCISMIKFAFHDLQYPSAVYTEAAVIM